MMDAAVYLKRRDWDEALAMNEVFKLLPEPRFGDGTKAKLLAEIAGWVLYWKHIDAGGKEERV